MVIGGRGLQLLQRATDDARNAIFCQPTVLLPARSMAGVAQQKWRAAGSVPRAQRGVVVRKAVVLQRKHNTERFMKTSRALYKSWWRNGRNSR